ncbi:hypothetical protein ACHAXR_010588 [Thalassiosira sp. AJA248-18]
MDHQTDSVNHQGTDDDDVLRRRRPNSCLTTPLIDISHLDSSSGNDRDGPMQQHEPNRPPEAGLHRDGEQARLVEEVRRRQRQQRQYHEDTTFQFLEESASQLWESILVYGGLIEDPRNRSIARGPHSTMPLNSHRDKSQQNGNQISSSDSKANENTHQISQPLVDESSSSGSPINSKHPPFIRFVLRVLLRILYTFRWSIDSCIMRLAHLEPLLPHPYSPIYSTSPEYSLQITADDILCSMITIWVSFYWISRTQHFAGPMVVMIMMCLFFGSVRCKATRRLGQSRGNQHQIQEQQLQQRKDATIAKIQPDSFTSKDAIATNNNEHPHARAIQRLQRQHPDATHAEIKRFFTCVKYKEEDASKRIHDFLKWRSDCGLKNVEEAEGIDSAKGTSVQNSRFARVYDQDFVKKDERDWDAAAKLAISIITKSHVTESVANLPQIICSYEKQLEEGIDTNTDQTENSPQPPPRCKDGTRILHILPFRLDLSLATAPTYSLAAALYLDRRFSRSTAERINLFCDVRGGRGWANPTPWSTLPFIQSTASLLGSHYPERLERLVLFPMPKSAIWVWSAAQKCLDPNTASKVVIVSNSSAEGNGVPEGLEEFVDGACLNVLEERRRSFFGG